MATITVTVEDEFNTYTRRVEVEDRASFMDLMIEVDSAFEPFTDAPVESKGLNL